VITQRILSQVRPGAIILSHDIHKQTVDAMPATLDALIAKGYKFVTVTQLIAMNKPKPSPSPTANSGDEQPPVKNPKATPTAKKTEVHTQRPSQEGSIQGDSGKPDPSGKGQ
jgi:peptidoglycan-N-acetylglucosamine deacetylase